MPRDLPLSNGRLMINFDHEYNIRDVYYPHVGGDNQTAGDVSFFGVWCDDIFKWIGDASWEKTLDYEDGTLVTRVVARSAAMSLEMTINDTVDFDRDLFVRRIELRNLLGKTREAKLYQHFDPHLWGNNIGDTIFFDPDFSGLVAYKGARYVVLNGMSDETFGFQAFAIGQKEREGFQGTWRDAEDGNLQRNAIAQGSVDATGMIRMTIPPGEARVAWIWFGFGESYREIAALDRFVRERGPASFLERTSNYWKLWGRSGVDVSRLPENLQRLYRRSLLIIRTQIDSSGAVIAATDSDIVQFGKDTYTYMWPRDGAIVTAAMIHAGYGDITRRFFEFCSHLPSDEGFLLHKYNADGSVGSSWHPWMSADGKRQLPIQEDETALVLWALWQHFEKFHDVEFVRPLYKPMVKTMADFLARYREPHTRLPAASWDLWEERRGITAFTTGAVWSGLNAAACFTYAFGESAQADRYRRAAAEIREAAERHLYSAELGRFVRMINVSHSGEITVDATLDASLAGLWLFGMFEPHDEKIVATMKALIDRLTVKSKIGGLARYENDYYFQVSKDVDKIPGNPWVLCTLSLASWYAVRAQNESDLQKAIDVLTWACDRAMRSGVLPEQVDPFTGKPVSVAPLTWSHAAFVHAVHAVADRMNRLA